MVESRVLFVDAKQHTRLASNSTLIKFKSPIEDRPQGQSPPFAVVKHLGLSRVQAAAKHDYSSVSAFQCSRGWHLTGMAKQTGDGGQIARWKSKANLHSNNKAQATFVCNSNHQTALVRPD